MKSTCAIAGCERPGKARGLCNSHRGTLKILIQKKRITPQEAESVLRPPLRIYNLDIVYAWVQDQLRNKRNKK